MSLPRSLGSAPRSPWSRGCLAAFACASIFSLHAQAVMLSQIDTFQDGTVLAWLEGAPSPNPPTNIATGGPLGAGDAYLQNISSGPNGPGSRLVMFNSAQWGGDYLAAGVTQIVGQMANFGETNLFMRITLTGGPEGDTRFGSTNRFVLPPDGLWRTVTFDLSPSGLTQIGGAGTLPTLLADVAEIRVLSAEAAPNFLGDFVAATLGMDNLRAVPEPSVAAALLLGALYLAPRRRRFQTVASQNAPGCRQADPGTHALLSGTAG